MLFRISRTSGAWEAKPVPSAKRIKCLRVDRRTCKTPAAFDKLGIEKEPWLSKGEHHEIVNREIVRYFPAKAWMIEIADLTSLMCFANIEGRIVLSPSDTFDVTLDRGPLPSIEIYDGYRE